MDNDKQKLTWFFMVLLLGLGLMNTREFHKMRANFSSAIYPAIFKSEESKESEAAKMRVSKAQVDEIGRKTSEFDNTQLQLIFESLVKSYNSNFNERSAKIDFGALYISEADLKTLGNIVTDQQREENERNVALYILSQIGESALSTLTFIALSDISCCDIDNSEFELALRIKAFETINKLSSYDANST